MAYFSNWVIGLLKGALQTEFELMFIVHENFKKATIELFNWRNNSLVVMCK